MTYLPEVRDALGAVIGDRARQPVRRRAVRAAELITWAGGAVFLLVVVAIAVRFAVGAHGPSARTAMPRAASPAKLTTVWQRDSLQALVDTAKRDRVCWASRAPQSRQERYYATAEPPRQLRSLLSAMRHPSPAQMHVSDRAIARLGIDGLGIYMNYVRQGVVNGVHWFMVPVAHLDPNELPARFFRERSAAFQTLSATLPASQHAGADAFERTRLRREQGPQPPGIEVITTAGGGGTGSTDFPVSRLRAQRFWSGGSGGNDRITTTVILVPDKVATVGARYGAQTRPGRVPRPVTIVKPVNHNIVLFVFRGAWDPPALVFRSSSGTLLSTAGVRP
jgi:hypothetical protein